MTNSFNVIRYLFNATNLTINSKSQIPNSKQYPNSNFQILNRLRFGIWCLGFVCYLVLGAWRNLIFSLIAERFSVVERWTLNVFHSITHSLFAIYYLLFAILFINLTNLYCEEYRIHPGDEIEVFVWQSNDFTRKAVVQLDGTIPYPIIGRLEVAGKTPNQVEKELSEFLSKYIKFPQVSVLILGYAYRQVAIIGEVRRPKSIPVVKEVKLSEVIANAEGFTSDAYLKRVTIMRTGGPTFTVFKVNLKEILEGKREDVVLQPGDIVYIPRSAVGSWRWIVNNIMPTLTLILTFITLSRVL